jgi:hypothetical protein
MTEDVQRWAGASFYKYHENLAGLIDHWFEVHPDIERLRSGWLGWAIENQAHCELQELHSELEHSARYPIEAITKRFGRYFTSTAAYMIASAIHVGAKEIGLFGVNMSTDSEYMQQRPCCEYLIGLARGMGIEVFVSDGSPLTRCKWIYGYERPEGGWSAPLRLVPYADAASAVA